MAGGCHLFDRWTPGSITNGDQILRSCEKQVVDEFDRQVPEQGAALKDASALKPDLVVCVNPIENWVMLHECGMHGVPTIGIIDTDANPTWVTYPIPANDDSMRCVQVIAGALGRAGQEGQANRREAALAGEVTYRPNRPKRMADRMNASPRAVEAATGLANTGDSGMGPAADGGANRARNSEIDKNLGYHSAELGS